MSVNTEMSELAELGSKDGLKWLNEIATDEEMGALADWKYSFADFPPEVEKCPEPRRLVVDLIRGFPKLPRDPADDETVDAFWEQIPGNRADEPLYVIWFIQTAVVTWRLRKEGESARFAIADL